MPGPRGTILKRTPERLLLLHEGNIAVDEDSRVSRCRFHGVL
jgi:hypothetical protein